MQKIINFYSVFQNKIPLMLNGSKNLKVIKIQEKTIITLYQKATRFEKKLNYTKNDLRPNKRMNITILEGLEDSREAPCLL